MKAEHVKIQCDSYAIMLRSLKQMNRWKDDAVLLDDLNTVVPHQRVQSTTITGRVRLSFMADLPATLQPQPDKPEE